MPEPTIRRARQDDREAVLGLLEAAGLEAEFVAAEFQVAAANGQVVACARMKPLADGSHELASVAVAPELRGTGVGRSVVSVALAGARGAVHALALAPGFFEKLGFRRVAAAPEVLREKAEGFCASKGFVPMVCESPSPAGAG